MAAPAAPAEARTLALFVVGSRCGGLEAGVPHLSLWKGGLVAGLGWAVMASANK